jgi:putative transposase
MKPAGCRVIVDHLRGAWRVSARRACAVLRAPRSSYHHRSRRGAQAELRQRIREIAETRVRYGYRRIHVLLRRGSRHCLGRRRLAGW